MKVFNSAPIKYEKINHGQIQGFYAASRQNEARWTIHSTSFLTRFFTFFYLGLIFCIAVVGAFARVAFADTNRPSHDTSVSMGAAKTAKSSSVFDFMTPAQVKAVKTRSLAYDDTSAINAAIAVSPKRTLHFPAGTYVYDGGGVLSPGQVLSGDGRHATIIEASTPSSVLFRVSGYGAGIEHMAFYAKVAQTGGSYVVLSGPESFIRDFYMTGDFNGITMTGNVARIRHGRFQNGAPGATRIIASGGDNSQLIDDVLMGAQRPEVSKAGIEVTHSSALIISDTSVIQQGVGLLVDPKGRENSVFSLTVHDCFFDTNKQHGIVIAPRAGANVVRTRFVNTWASSSGSDGIVIDNPGAGMVSGIQFIALHAINNQGSGLTTAGNVSDLTVIGGDMANNQFGIYINGRLNGLHVLGATIGEGAGVPGNHRAGIVLSKATVGIDVVGNDLRGNGEALLDPSESDSKIIANNLGFNPLPNTTIALGRSPFTWRNSTGGPVNVYIDGGQISALRIGNHRITPQPGLAVVLPPGGELSMVYAQPPTLSYAGF